MQLKRSKVDHSTLDLSIKRQRLPGPLGVVTQSGSWIYDKLNHLN